MQTDPLPAGLTGELLWTKAETGRVLRVSVDTVANLHRTGRLRGLLVGRHLRWRPQDVAAFVAGLSAEDTR